MKPLFDGLSKHLWFQNGVRMSLIKFLKAFLAKILELIRCQHFLVDSCKITFSKSFLMTENFQLNFSMNKMIIIRAVRKFIFRQVVSKNKDQTVVQIIVSSWSPLFDLQRKVFWFNVTVTCLSRQKRYTSNDSGYDDVSSHTI